MTDLTDIVYVADRMTGSAYQKRLTDEKTLSDAKAQAAEIIAEAERHAETLAGTNPNFDGMGGDNNEYSGDDEQDKVTATINAFVALSDLAAEWRREMQTVESWLPDAVFTCVEKIVGAMKREALLKKVVKKSLEDLSDLRELTLKTARPDLPKLEAIALENPEIFGAFSQIVADPDLTCGEMRVVGSGGLLDIGLETQLAALKSAICTTSDATDV